MDKTELIQLIAKGMSNEINLVFPYIAADCQYFSSGENRASGKDAVCEFLKNREAAQKRAGVRGFAYAAKIDKSEEEGIEVGTDCVAVSMYDPYNCVGFFTIQQDSLGNIKEFNFHTTPKVTFQTLVHGKHKIKKVPADAHEAIAFRAHAFGIIDRYYNKNRHYRKYPVFNNYVPRVYNFILHSLFTDFEKGIANAAGYLFVTGMSEAIRGVTGRELFAFDETVSTNRFIPKVDERYQDWVNKGFDVGNKLFLGFNEYVHLRKPDDEQLREQMKKSLFEMAVLGSIQANKLMDLVRARHANVLKASYVPGNSDLHKAIQDLMAAETEENKKAFMNIFKSHVINHSWVHMVGKSIDNGKGGVDFHVHSFKNNGKLYVGMFSDPSEIRSAEFVDVFVADIFNLFDAVFSNRELAGIIINPFTSQICIESDLMVILSLEEHLVNENRNKQ